MRSLFPRQVRRLCTKVSEVLLKADTEIVEEVKYEAPKSKEVSKWPGHKLREQWNTKALRPRIPDELSTMNLHRIKNIPASKASTLRFLAEDSSHPKRYTYSNFLLGCAKEIHSKLVAQAKTPVTDDVLHAINYVMPEISFPKARSEKRTILYHAGNPHSNRAGSSLYRFAHVPSAAYCSNDPMQVEQVFRVMTLRGIPCNLRTPTKTKMMPGAKHVCCTLGELDLSTSYNVVIIEDGDMAADKVSGWKWTYPILGAACSELHILGDIQGEPIARNISQACSEKFRWYFYPLEEPTGGMELHSFWDFTEITPTTDSPFSSLADLEIRPNDVIAIDSYRQIPELCRFINRNIVLLSDAMPVQLLIEALSHRNPTSTLVVEKGILARDVLRIPVDRLIVVTEGANQNRKACGRCKAIVATPDVIRELKTKPSADHKAGLSPLQSHLSFLDMGIKENMIPTGGMSEDSTLYDYFNKWAMVDPNRYFVCKIPNAELTRTLWNLPSIEINKLWTLLHLPMLLDNRKYFEQCAELMLSGEAVEAPVWDPKEESPEVLIDRVGEYILHESLSVLFPHSFVKTNYVSEINRHLRQALKLLGSQTVKTQLPPPAAPSPKGKSIGMGLLGEKLSFKRSEIVKRSRKRNSQKKFDF
eukprot:TRINITY_DN356_c0_g1_i2.p1 TRINITY_DN356_c0_g1~~TRINITY_DN356_c0_g1_i2.p1  ORF type:complete len:645 (+),score=75.75 TRINITY_DN356_c0_g1_i2:98-2032(+)